MFSSHKHEHMFISDSSYAQQYTSHANGRVNREIIDYTTLFIAQIRAKRPPAQTINIPLNLFTYLSSARR